MYFSGQKLLYECSLCNAEDFHQVYEYGSYSSKMHVALCKNCGLLCLNPRWNEEAYSEYYKTNYYVETGMSKSIDDSYDVSGGQREDQIYHSIKKTINKADAILEVGAGNGTNAVWLYKNNFSNISCVEVDPICCQRIEKHYPAISVTRGSLKEFAEIKENHDRFDLVILSHVLEHFVRPELALLLIRNLLKENRFLYIRVPNIFAAERPYSQFMIPHTHYFSKVTLELLLEKAGFDIVKETECAHDELAFTARKIDIKRMPVFDCGEFKRAIKFLRSKYPFSFLLKTQAIHVIENTMSESTYRYIRRLIKKNK